MDQNGMTIIWHWPFWIVMLSPKVTRFKTRDNVILRTVKVDFQSQEEQDHCIKQGVLCSGVKLIAEKYIPKRWVIQCYNCWKFGHVAKLCPYNESCVNCSQKHKRCDIQEFWQYKCTNCGENHPANNKICRIYKEHEYNILKVSTDNQNKNNLSIQDY